jgi:hypothetical protein
MDMSLMRDFEELEGLHMDNAVDENAVADDDDDEGFAPVDVQSLSSADLYYELDKRGIKSSGFQDSDRETLQKIFNEEFQANLEVEKARRKEAKRRAQLQAGLQKRRMLMETTLQEEQDSLATNHQLSIQLELIRENSVGHTLRLDVGSVISRVLAKAMWANDTVTSLDLSSNELNDHAGAYLARILKRNNVLKKIELEDNLFGTRTATAFGESLKINTSLTYLSLDSNPLVQYIPPTLLHEEMETKIADVSGIKAFSEALKVNKTIVSINLWRTGLSAPAGKLLADAMQFNDKLLFFEVGGNLVDAKDTKRLATKLTENLENYEMSERNSRKQAAEDAKDVQLLKDAEDKAQKDKDLKEWLAQRREQRADDRRTGHDNRILESIEAAKQKAAMIEAERKAAAKKAEEEEAKAKAKKKK